MARYYDRKHILVMRTTGFCTLLGHASGETRHRKPNIKMISYGWNSETIYGELKLTKLQSTLVSETDDICAIRRDIDEQVSYAQFVKHDVCT